jgi:hypothetical protein
MRIGGQDYRSIWINEATGNLEIIDQTMPPHLLTVRVIGDVRRRQKPSTRCGCAAHR